MLLRYSFLLLLAFFHHVLAADTTTSTESDTTTSATGADSITTITSATSISEPSGSYLSYTTTVIVTSNILSNDNETTTSTSTETTTSTSGNSTTTATSTSTTELVLTGTDGTKTSSATSTATNTQACNGYTEFCDRKYSNITMVTAHNSPFVKKNNIASNQEYTVKTQLDDGVRMLSFEAHYDNETIYLCHSSCDLLNMGTLEDYLTTVVSWMKDNPYDVVTILIVNSDYVSPGNFSAPIINSGLSEYTYEPWKIPMALDDWPTLTEMIFAGKRAVVFMDYQANQTAYPYILDEFTQMWETPFSPTNRSFPCTRERPPGITTAEAEDRLYLINHNLNLEITFEDLDILIPDTAEINVTNAVSGTGSLGLMANNCVAKWDRAPNFLLVDYYNDGNFQGSVFEVAATMNNVTYNGKCCGASSSSATKMGISWSLLCGVAVFLVLL